MPPKFQLNPISITPPTTNSLHIGFPANRTKIAKIHFATSISPNSLITSLKSPRYIQAHIIAFPDQRLVSAPLPRLARGGPISH